MASAAWKSFEGASVYTKYVDGPGWLHDVAAVVSAAADADGLPMTVLCR